MQIIQTVQELATVSFTKRKRKAKEKTPSKARTQQKVLKPYSGLQKYLYMYVCVYMCTVMYMDYAGIATAIVKSMQTMNTFRSLLFRNLSISAQRRQLKKKMIF